MDYVRTISDTSYSSTSNSLTFSMWVYPIGSYGYPSFFSESYQGVVPFLWFYGPTNFTLPQSNIQYSDGTQIRVTNVDNIINLNNWSLLTISFDFNTGVIKRYVNGSLLHTFTAPGPMLFPSRVSKKFIGTYSGSYDLIRAKIDDTRIYNRALSADEIKAIYDSTK